MHDDHEKVPRDWRLPDERWERIVLSLIPHQPQLLGHHRPRVDERKAMDTAMSTPLLEGSVWGDAGTRGGNVGPVMPWQVGLGWVAGPRLG
jgi:hypothetical protein